MVSDFAIMVWRDEQNECQSGVEGEAWERTHPLIFSFPVGWCGSFPSLEIPHRYTQRPVSQVILNSFHVYYLLTQYATGMPVEVRRHTAGVGSLLHRLGLGHRTQMIGLGGRCLCLLDILLAPGSF